MNKYTCHKENQNSGNGFWGGLIVLSIGLIFLLHKLDLELPHWLFSWPMLLIFIGCVLGIKNKFQGAGWFILTAIGAVFLVNDIVPFEWHLQRYFWPIVLIAIGIYMIGRAASRKKQFDDIMFDLKLKGDIGAANPAGGTSFNPEDYIRTSTMFGSTNKVVLSKNFQGGNVTTIFGGTELNFMQADINGEAVLEITALFGGVELTVPSNWDVKMDVSTMFGGIEDKRTVVPGTGNKVLVIKGSCTFGGVDLKSH